MANTTSLKVIQGSDETFDKCCSPCLEDGISREAKKYCVDCEIYYCEQCIKYHDKIPSSRRHQTIDKSGHGFESVGTSVQLERCVTHHGKEMDMYCRDHNLLCCEVCISTKHRTCKKVEALVNAAKGIRESEDFKETQKSLLNLLPKLEAEKGKRMANIANIDKQKEVALHSVNEYEEQVTRKICELAEKSRAQITSTHRNQTQNIENEINPLESLITMFKLSSQKISGGNDVQTFANILTAKCVIEDGRTILEEMSKQLTERSLGIIIYSSLQSTIEQAESLGEVTTDNNVKEDQVEEDVKEYKAELYRKFAVSSTGTSITALCLHGMDNLLLFDWNSRHLKRLSSTDFKVIDELQMEDSSYSVCSVGSTDVAVAYYDRQKIQFVSVSQSMSLKSSFQCNHRTVNVAFNSDDKHLFVSTETKIIYVYNINGICLRSFEFPGQMSCELAFCGNSIVIGEKNSGLVCTDFRGNCRWSFTDFCLKEVRGVVVMPNGSTLVCAARSNKLLQVSKNGKKIGELLGMHENLCHPHSLAFDKKTSRLFFGCAGTKLYVYTVSKTN